MSHTQNALRVIITSKARWKCLKFAHVCLVTYTEVSNTGKSSSCGALPDETTTHTVGEN